MQTFENTHIHAYLSFPFTDKLRGFPIKTSERPVMQFSEWLGRAHVLYEAG